MSAIYEKLGAGQPAFSTETQEGDYTIEHALGAAEPTALLIKARFKQYRANYSRPAANTTLSYGSSTAYFIDDVDFLDERGGLQSWTRLWATIPASWSEPGGTYAYTFPGYSGSTAWGTVFPVSGIAIANSNAIVNTNATGINVSDDVYFDLNYVRAAANYHVTFHLPVLAASSGVSLTIPSVLPGTSTFDSSTGTVRKGDSTRPVAETLEVDSRLVHDYALSSDAALDTELPQIDKFSPVSYAGYGTNGNEVSYLTGGTVPTTSQYVSMIAAGTEIVAARSERRRYMGNIYERITRLVKAR